MTEQQAEKAANIIIGVVVVAGAVAILRIPAARRTLWQVTRTAVRAAGPWLVAEARRAWEESGARVAPASGADSSGESRTLENASPVGVRGPAPTDFEVPAPIDGVERQASGEVDVGGATERAGRVHVEGGTTEGPVRQPAI